MTILDQVRPRGGPLEEGGEEEPTPSASPLLAQQPPPSLAWWTQAERDAGEQAQQAAAAEEEGAGAKRTSQADPDQEALRLAVQELGLSVGELGRRLSSGPALWSQRDASVLGAAPPAMQTTEASGVEQPRPEQKAPSPAPAAADGTEDPALPTSPPPPAGPMADYTFSVDISTQLRQSLEAQNQQALERLESQISLLSGSAVPTSDAVTFQQQSGASDEAILASVAEMLRPGALAYHPGPLLTEPGGRASDDEALLETSHPPLESPMGEEGPASASAADTGHEDSQALNPEPESALFTPQSWTGGPWWQQGSALPAAAHNPSNILTDSEAGYYHYLEHGTVNGPTATPVRPEPWAGAPGLLGQSQQSSGASFLIPPAPRQPTRGQPSSPAHPVYKRYLSISTIPEEDSSRAVESALRTLSEKVSRLEHEKLEAAQVIGRLEQELERTKLAVFSPVRESSGVPAPQQRSPAQLAGSTTVDRGVETETTGPSSLRPARHSSTADRDSELLARLKMENALLSIQVKASVLETQLKEQQSQLRRVEEARDSAGRSEPAQDHHVYEDLYLDGHSLASVYGSRAADEDSMSQAATLAWHGGPSAGTSCPASPTTRLAEAMLPPPSHRTPTAHPARHLHQVKRDMAIFAPQDASIQFALAPASPRCAPRSVPDAHADLNLHQEEQQQPPPRPMAEPHLSDSSANSSLFLNDQDISALVLEIAEARRAKPPIPRQQSTSRAPTQAPPSSRAPGAWHPFQAGHFAATPARQDLHYRLPTHQSQMRAKASVLQGFPLPRTRVAFARDVDAVPRRLAAHPSAPADGCRTSHRHASPVLPKALLSGPAAQQPLPFVVGTNTGKSYSVPANIQVVHHLMKGHHPDFCRCCSDRKTSSAGLSAASLAAYDTGQGGSARRADDGGCATRNPKLATNLPQIIRHLEREYQASRKQYRNLLQRLDLSAESGDRAAGALSAAPISKADRRQITQALRAVILDMEHKSEQLGALRAVYQES